MFMLVLNVLQTVFVSFIWSALVWQLATFPMGKCLLV